MTNQDEIYPRDIPFSFVHIPRHWLDDDLYITHMFNAPSLISPYIEGLVNSIVLKAMDHLQNENLKAACHHFIKQESMHAREHLKYNLMLKKQGYHFDKVVTKIKNKFGNFKKNWSLLSLLAIAVGFECLTATISQIVLEENILEKANKTMRRFWRWHMMEELEHKTLLMNLYQELGGGYIRRSAIFLLVLFGYSFYLLKIYLHFIKIDKASLFKGLTVVLGKKSFFRKSLVKSLTFYRYRYHPKQTNTAHLLDFETIV